jgi:hypothetical protein
LQLHSFQFLTQYTIIQEFKEQIQTINGSQGGR